MPLVDDKSVLPSIFAPIGQQSLPEEPVTEPAPPLLDTLGAWMRSGNSVGSSLQFNTDRQGVTNDAVPDYNAWKDIAGTEYESYWPSFTNSNNPGYTAFLKRRIDRENEDRRTIEASSGVASFIAGIGAVATDPLSYVPLFGLEGAAGRTAWVLARGAAAGAGGVAIQEAALQATQETRTGTESAIAIGGGAVLGAVLGGGIAAIMSRAETQAAEKALVTIATTPMPGSVGAAAVERPTVEGLTVAGRLAGATAKATQWISPVLRLQHSPSEVVREIAGQLYDGSTYLNIHGEGQTLGPSAEILSRSKYQGRDIQLTRGFDDIYSQMKKAGQNLSKEQFWNEVGIAMTRGDVGINDFVTQAAKLGRSTMADSYFAEGKAVGIFDEAEDVKFAPSYFPRQYRTKFMVQNEFALKDKLLPHMEGFISQKYEKARANVSERIAAGEQEKVDLGLTPEARAETSTQLQAAQEELALSHARELQLVEDIKTLRQEKPPGWRKQLKTLKEQGGERLQEAVKKRAALASRIKKFGLDLTPEQVAARVDAITARAAKAEARFAAQWGKKQDVAGTGFRELSKDILDDFFDKVLHRKFGDQSSIMPDYLTPLERGPIKERTLPIPDNILHSLGMMEQNALEVLRRYGRTVGADIELTKKFGSPTLVDQRTAIAHHYAELSKAVAGDPKKLAALNARMHQDVRDIEAGRDLVRGTYRAKENMSEYGRTVRAAMHMQFVLKMGGVLISSLGELIRPAMVHGLGTYVNEGLRPVVSNLKAFRAVAKEGELAGAVGERILNQRMLGMSGLMDQYAQGNTLERFIENMASVGNKWSGISALTDFEKNMASVLTQHKVLDGAISGKNTRLLRYLGISEEMEKRIAGEFAVHGETIDGVRVAHTENWADAEAVDHYRAAIFKDVNTQIITPGMGDLPLFMRSPTGRLITQFKSFNLAAHQKVLLRGLQEDKANFVSGLIGLSMIGMLVSALKAWRGGEDRWQKFLNKAENPGYLLAEGLDSSGIFALPMDAANTVENLSPGTGFTFNPIKTPIELAGYAATGRGDPMAQSLRFAYRSPVTALLGPTAGTVEDVSRASGGAANLARGEDVTSAQRNAATKLLPFNSYFPVRELLQLGDDSSPYGDW